VSKSECAPQRVVVSLGEGVSSAAPSSATGRFIMSRETGDISGKVWHRLKTGESCRVPPRTGMFVLTAVGSDMHGEASYLMFRGEGRLTGPLVYSKERYWSARVVALIAAILVGILLSGASVTIGLFKGFDERIPSFIMFALPNLGGPAVLAAIATMFAMSYRKTRTFQQPDWQAVDVDIEAVPAEVRP
jgi:hypothetical protein